MREIKFRAWDKLTNTMQLVTDLKAMPLGSAVSFDGGEYWCLAFELMEFTGLKDKNGKEIYEGDIVKFHDLSVDMDFEAVPIVFNSCCFRADTLIGFRALHDRVMEVIGNIYENPDLIGG